MSQAQLYCRITNTTTCEKLPSVNGKQWIYIRKNSSTSKSKRLKQENTYADKIQTNFDPRNAERNLKDEIDLIFLFQNIGAKSAKEKLTLTHFIIVHPIPSG